MEPAFLFPSIFPPPAPRTDVLARLDSPGTWTAPDARIIPVMKRIVGNIVFPNVVPDLLICPTIERIYLENGKLLIPFQSLKIRAVLALFFAKSANPRLQGPKLFPQGIDFANFAAQFSLFQ